LLRGIPWPLKMRPSETPIGPTGLRTQRPIKQIAAEAGFQNEKSFMRAFKGWTGQTPEEFRSMA
jgi:AraC-like DNA-binding protein